MLGVNMTSIGLEIPYMMSSCFNFMAPDKNEIKSYSDMMHQINQGIVRLALNYFYFEEFIFLIFYGEFFMSAYFLGALVFSGV